MIKAWTPRRRSPRRRSTNDFATTTPSSRPRGQLTINRRYIGSFGILPRLWQRQNDANSAPVAQRRITDASQTLDAARRFRPARRRRFPVSDRCTPDRALVQELRSELGHQSRTQGIRTPLVGVWSPKNAQESLDGHPRAENSERSEPLTLPFGFAERLPHQNRWRR